MSLRRKIQAIQLLHRRRVFENPRDLGPGRDELQDVPVVFQRSALVLGSMAHLQRVLEDGDELFDLVVVEDSRRYPSFRGQPFEQIDPFGPFAVRRASNPTFVRLKGNGELIFGDEVESAFGKDVVDGGQDLVLLSDVKVDGEVEQLSLLRCNRPWRRRVEQLMWSVKLVAV